MIDFLIFLLIFRVEGEIQAAAGRIEGRVSGE
jgi:hypothetical protein